MITKEVMEAWMTRANDHKDPLCAHYAQACAMMECAVSIAFVGKTFDSLYKLGLICAQTANLITPVPNAAQSPNQPDPNSEIGGTAQKTR